MFYLTSKFHVNRINTFGFMEGGGGGGAFEAPPPPGPGTPKNPGRIGFNFCSLTDYQKLLQNCSLFVNLIPPGGGGGVKGGGGGREGPESARADFNFRELP